MPKACVEVAKMLPLKQGLKQSYSACTNIACPSCKDASTKTRIETHNQHLESVRHQVAKMLPLKQGLKLSVKVMKVRK